MKKKIVLILIILSAYQGVFSQENTDFSIKNLNSNNQYDDLGVSFFNDDFVIYSSYKEFKSYNPHTRNFKRHTKKVKSSKNLDYFFGTLINSEIENSQKLSNQINSKFDDKGLCFDNEQEYVFFSREDIIAGSDKKHFELFRASVVSPGSWKGVRKLPFNNQEYSIMYPCLSDDNKTLYFTSNKGGNYDIYKIALLSEWGFGKPEKLGVNINSLSDETSPFIKNGVLYFSSNRVDSQGGFDVYSINLNDKKAVAKKMEGAINSSYDDICFIVKNTGVGFFSSNRPGGKGGFDIYSLKNLELAKDIVEVKTDDKTIVVTKEVLVKNESAYDFQRRDSYDKHVETTEVKVVNKNKGKIKSKFTNKNNVKVNDNYSECQLAFDSINNVYFDYSEFYIREDAARELDKVIGVLRKCPKIKMLVASHTDSRASNSYNLDLSQKRTSSVVRYIIQNGNFSEDRIIGVGYGEARLSNRCSDGVKCSEKEHQNNRRTHFEIYNY